jgi:hypothetical protein
MQVTIDGEYLTSSYISVNMAKQKTSLTCSLHVALSLTLKTWDGLVTRLTHMQVYSIDDEGTS